MQVVVFHVRAFARQINFYHAFDLAGAGGHNDHQIGQKDGFNHAVRDEYHSFLFFFQDLDQLALHVLAGLGVQRAKRFVHQQHFGVVSQRACDGHALLHAAGEGVWICLFEALQMHQVDIFARFFLSPLFLPAVMCQSEGDVAQYSQPWE